MARIIGSNFTNSMTPGLRKVYLSRLQGIEQEFRQIFNIIPSRPGSGTGLRFFDDLRFASLGTAAHKPEGQALTFDVPDEETTVRYTAATFALGFRITEEAKEDELYSVFEKMTQELAMAHAHQMEVQAFRVLNNGFGTTGGGTGLTVAGFNSEALFSNSHTLIRGGTYSNRRATDLDLSVTALELALDTFENTVNESNMPMPRKANLLLIPQELHWIAKEITQSELKPYTGNNEVNPLGGEGLKYMVTHYTRDDTDRWFLLSPKAQHDLNVWIRREPRMQTGDDFDTGDTKVKGGLRMASGHGDYRGTFGSQGA